MELLQLYYFLQLANIQHVSRTAERLCISQPSLSATIKKLENELGVPLFVRKGRSIALSPYGAAYKAYVEDAFLSLDNGKQTIAKMRGISDRRLVLGVLSPYIWNELFRHFAALHPEVVLSRYSIEDYHFMDDILTGKIDFYLGSINQVQPSDLPKLEYITLYEDEMVLLVNTDHPLARQKEIDLRQCSNEPFINLDDSTRLQQFVNTIFAKAGFRPRVIMVCDYTLRDQMVAEGHGIAVTTRSSAQQTQVKNVTWLPITHPSEKRKLGLVWRRGKTFSDAMDRFYEVTCQFYQDNPPSLS